MTSLEKNMIELILKCLIDPILVERLNFGTLHNKNVDGNSEDSISKSYKKFVIYLEIYGKSKGI